MLLEFLIGSSTVLLGQLLHDRLYNKSIDLMIMMIFQTFNKPSSRGAGCSTKGRKSKLISFRKLFQQEQITSPQI